ncbi:trimeric intracellular cation channel family protein [Bifidobacterium magnum]|uniref:Membrane protein n=1 Tax=Bifidobacterium magnum TaxID=1692 RepID=A0A087B6C6_9BIFI|nr:TRIC cation channel family protein [Bifidobacterium magnum]KFI66576.1 membrane protein [Bifidobacterium magnum]
MGIALQTSPFFQLIEYLAVFFCGIGGGMAAIRKQFDLLTIVITSWLTALGGGMIRDVFLGALPPVGVSNIGFVLTALVSGLIVAVIHPEVHKLKWTMLTLDALALALFAVNGTSKALMYNTSGMTAVFLGTFTAMGGGLIRDILLNEVPQVIKDRHWYIVPAVVGSILTVVVWQMEQQKHITFQMEFILDVAIVVLVVLLRLASVKFDIQVPGAVQRTRAHLPSGRFVRHVVHRARLDGEKLEEKVDARAGDSSSAAQNAGSAQDAGKQ